MQWLKLCELSFVNCIQNDDGATSTCKLKENFWEDCSVSVWGEDFIIWYIVCMHTHTLYLKQ